MPPPAAPAGVTVTLFLCGDVMTGRGIDQILPHPGAPHLYEPYVRSARGLRRARRARERPDRAAGRFRLRLGRRARGARARAPDARIVNLETTVTAAEDAWPDKGINYRMHPANVGVPDRGRDRLLRAREQPRARLGHAGSSRRSTRCAAPASGPRAPAATQPKPRRRPRSSCRATGRVLVFAFASETSGIPRRGPPARLAPA